MRKPNGYGSVIRLSGKRRNPYAVRITTGWDDNAKQQYKYIGYYSSRKAAEMALADYNKNPYSIQVDITFAELFDRYINAKRKNLSESTYKAYTVCFRSCKDLFNVSILKLNLDLLQRHIDESPQNKPSLTRVKSLWSNMFDYAIKNRLLPPDAKAHVTYVDLSNKDNPNTIKRTNFTHEEVSILWEHSEEVCVQSVLILLYTGVRISEMLNLTDISERYFSISNAKTKAGNREVPICDKILPFFKDMPYLGMTYPTYMKYMWKPCMKYISPHLPHDARHTFISFMTEKEIDPRIIKAIVGHEGSGVTEMVYTHIPMRKLIESVNKLD